MVKLILRAKTTRVFLLGLILINVVKAKMPNPAPKLKKSINTTYDSDCIIGDSVVIHLPGGASDLRAKRLMENPGSHPFIVPSKILRQDHSNAGNFTLAGKRIVEGHHANNGQFPIMARITPTFEDFSYLCGGTIIANVWILTAAHCLSPLDKLESVPIRVGSVYANRGGQFLYARTAIIHPGYIDYGDNTVSGFDLGLLRTCETIRMNGNVNFAWLPGLPNVSPGTVLNIGGWGVTGSGKISNRLKYGSSTVKRCYYYDAPNNTPSLDSVVCTINEGDRICSGDSGGFLGSYRDGAWVVDGIASYGPGGCGSGGTTGFTRVAYFQDWILYTDEGR